MKSNKIRLGEQCVVTSSKRFHLSERITQGVPFYCSKEIIKKFNGEDVTECDYISEDLYKKVSNEFGVPKENDLLITTRGTIGIPYLYKRTDRFYFADGNLTWIKDFDSNLYSKFLYYWFQSYEGRKKFEALAKGTAQKAVPISGIKTLEIELPSLKSQKRIADILSAYDDLIENNRKQIKLLEEAAQRLYKEWFVNLRFPGHENTKIVDGVPEGWRISSIYDVFDIKYGKNLPTSKITKVGQYPVYGASGVIGYYNEKNCDDYVTLVTSRGNGSGDVRRTHHKQSYVTNNSFIARRNDKNIFIKNEFTFQLFSNTDFKKLCTGSAQPQLTNTSIQKIKILLPNRQLIEKYQRCTIEMSEKQEALYKEQRALTQARNRLLSKLINGTVEV